VPSEFEKLIDEMAAYRRQPEAPVSRKTYMRTVPVPVTLPPTAADQRRSFNVASNNLMAKAMTSFQEGKISALEVARLQARIHLDADRMIR
jgi:hypothetical protein